jgi:hypothetical protein
MVRLWWSRFALRLPLISCTNVFENTLAPARAVNDDAALLA